MGVFDYLFGQPAPAQPAPTLDAIRGQRVVKGSVLPLSRDASGLHFDPTAGILGTLIGAATLPGDVYAGRADPATPEGFGRVMDLAGMMVGSGAPMAEEGALGIGGGKAITSGGSPVHDAILNAVKSDPSAAWGLRTLEEPVAVGDTLPPSRVWKNGDPTNKLLKGTSVTQIKGATPEAVAQAIQNQGIGGGPGQQFYFGRHVALVKGNVVKRGVDPGEALLGDPVVHSVFQKAGEGPEGFLP